MTVTAAPSTSSRRGGRHPVRRLMVAVLGLALLLYLGASIYLALQIRSSALDVHDPEPLTAVVAAVDEGRITLDDSVERRSPIRRSVLYGLAWAGGFGLVSGPPEQTTDTVTRDFEVTRGSAPEPGDTVDLVRDLVDPEATEPLVPTAEITYPSGRGDLPALFADARSSTWAILVHGKGASPAEMLRMAQATVGAGMPTLAIGYRNDPGVPADPSGRYAFGQTEWHDLEAAVAYAQGEGADGVVLGGASMGGGIVAAYLESSDRETGLVRGVVLDAPMLDLREVVRYGAEQLELPLGLHVPVALVATAERIDAQLYDVDWDAVDYLDDTDWLQVPALVMHTVDDQTVPPGISRAFAAQEPSLVDLEEFEGGHVEAYNADPGRYLAEVSAFLDRVQP